MHKLDSNLYYSEGQFSDYPQWVEPSAVRPVPGHRQFEDAEHGEVVVHEEGVVHADVAAHQKAVVRVGGYQDLRAVALAHEEDIVDPQLHLRLGFLASAHRQDYYWIGAISFSAASFRHYSLEKTSQILRITGVMIVQD